MPGLKLNDLVDRADTFMTTFTRDPLGALSTIDFKTVGVVGGAILLTIVLIDLVGYLFAAYNGTRRSYVPYSKSAVDFLVDAWDNKNYNYVGEYYDPYARARSLEPVTNVLDQLSAAWKKWEAQPSSRVNSRAFAFAE